jgi:hypothetical protein
MRYLIAAAVITAALSAPAVAALPNTVTFSSIDSIGRWIANYRARPDPMRVPAAVRALSQIGAFKEPEAAGVYVGFIAGVIGANPGKAEELIGKMMAIAPADHWVIVRAIAYSNHPDWKGLLRKFADRMPLRQVMIDKHLEDKLATLDDIPLEKKRPTLWDKVRGHFQREEDRKVPEQTLEQSPELLDTLWGCYFATGSYRPIGRIVSLLPWANEHDSVDKLTVGNMAKYTLATNAARDGELLDMLKRVSKREPKNVASVLNEIIEASETMQTTQLRKDALASIEDLKRKGPGSKRDISNWGQIGQGALALGCIAAAATGHVEFGLPCVIGGAASSAALSYWNNQQ